MIPYNQKMFSGELNQLGTYWLEKLPNVSFEETLRSCLEKRAYGIQPGHAQFYYPKKYGYGELWLRMADEIKNHIMFNKSANGIDFEVRKVTTSDNDEIQAEVIVTTIPWLEFESITGMPEELRKSIGKLKYSSIQTEYFDQKLDTSCHWIYYPDPKITYHRILVRHNFCPDSKGYWTETNVERINRKDSQLKGNFKYLNQYAYPLNTVDKPKIMNELLVWSKKRGVVGLGRWGEHQHYNSDVTVELALKLSEQLLMI